MKIIKQFYHYFLKGFLKGFKIIKLKINNGFKFKILLLMRYIYCKRVGIKLLTSL